MNFSIFKNLSPARIEAASLSGQIVKVKIEGFTAVLVSHGPAVLVAGRVIDSFTIFSSERVVSTKPNAQQIKSSIELLTGINLAGVAIV